MNSLDTFFGFTNDQRLSKKKKGLLDMIDNYRHFFFCTPYQLRFVRGPPEVPGFVTITNISKVRTQEVVWFRSGHFHEWTGQFKSILQRLFCMIKHRKLEGWPEGSENERIIWFDLNHSQWLDQLTSASGGVIQKRTFPQVHQPV